MVVLFIGATVYDRSEIDPMWLISDIDGDEENAVDFDQTQRNSNVYHVLVPKLIPRTWNERYTHSMSKAKSLCSIMAQSGGDQYATRYKVLDDIFQIWASGKEVVIAEIVKNWGKF